MNNWHGSAKGAFLLFTLGWITNAVAGGIIAYEIGTPDLGLADGFCE